MTFGRRGILEDIAATALMAGTVLGYAATHENWNVWLIGDSRRWTTGLLTVLAIAMFGLVARHIGSTATGVLGGIAAVLAVVAFWTASLTPLSLLGVTIILVWAVAVTHDLFVVPRRTVSI
jgi:hypothetical protein